MPDAVLKAELPPGACVLTASRAGLTSVRLAPRAEPSAGSCAAGAPPSAEALAILREAQRQLQAYFAGRLQCFELPLDLTGRTEFAQRVLRACAAIPYGETMSYGELAGRSGHPGAARAVGQVMATNPWAVVVPCHRVVGSDGRLTGYGYGLPCKQRLLRMERESTGWEAVT